MRARQRPRDSHRQGRQIDRLDLVARGLETGKQSCDGAPEARTVIELLQVRELVRDDVVDHRQCEMHEAPAQANAAVLSAGTPLRTRRRNRPRAWLDVD